MWILKTRSNGEWVAWTSSANPSNINKLAQLHEIVKPGIPYIIDKA